MKIRVEIARNSTVSSDVKMTVVTVFFLSFFLKTVQFLQLWPTLMNVEELRRVGSLSAMQLLPTEMRLQKPFTALLYLQQSPPIPNIVDTIIAKFFFDSVTRVPAIILIHSIASAVTAVLLTLLIVELNFSKKLAAVVSLIFLASSDLLLMEYHDFGYLLHEKLSMLLCTWLALLCVIFFKKTTMKNAVLIGLTTALLALTRSTFSYLGIFILFWIMLIEDKNKPRHIVAYLLPLILLQGGWSLKNYFVYDYWSLATSSWGGMNLMHGEVARNGKMFYSWVETHDPICSEPFNDAAKAIPLPFGFVPAWNKVKDLPAPIKVRDGNIASQLGEYWELNTIATREWTQCLQKQIGIYWKEHPEQLLNGFIKSWYVFWLPIRQFAIIFPTPLTMEGSVYSSDRLHFFEIITDKVQHWSNSFHFYSYYLQNKNLKAHVWTLPFVPEVFSAVSGLLFHSFPVLLLTAVLLRRSLSWSMSELILLSIVLYVAVLSSIVECCENMRFRLVVEPLIWCLAIEIARWWWQLLSTLYVRRSALENAIS